MLEASHENGVMGANYGCLSMHVSESLATAMLG